MEWCLVRILQLHSDFIEYKPIRKEIALAEEAEKKPVRLEEVVVLLTAVEEGDDKVAAQKAIDEVQAFLKKLKTNRILIYPYAHLSSNLAKPGEALRIIRMLEEDAEEKGIETYRAPFGWNKQFTLAIKGHPLAEQSRVYFPAPQKGQKPETEEKVSEAAKAEEKLKSFWYILEPNGKMIPVENYDFKGRETLEKFAKYEMSKVRASQQMPPPCTPNEEAGDSRLRDRKRSRKHSLVSERATDKISARAVRHGKDGRIRSDGS